MMTGMKTPEPRLLFDGFHERLNSKPPNFLESGLAPLDEIIVGLPESELILIAAQPSQGKTALAMQMSANIAVNGDAVGFFSMEMSRGQLADRLACSVAGIDSNRLRNRGRVPLSPKEIRILNEIIKENAKLPIFVDDRGGLSAEKIYTTAQTWKEKYNVKAIFLDYIQLTEDGNENRQEGIGSAARIFKKIAKELSVPFVALSQLNRASSSRESRTPKLSDLRDSGQLEQIADTVLMFSYPNSPEDDLDNIRQCEIHVKKQRNGPTGIANVMFDKVFTKFEPLEMSRLAVHSEEPTPTGKRQKWKAEQQTEASPS